MGLRKGDDEMDQGMPEAVIVINVQADFTEVRDGSLKVPGTDQAFVDRVVASTRSFKDDRIPIIATKDYHPADHVSFVTNHPGAKPFDVILFWGR